MEIGQRIAHARTAAGLTQTTLSRAVDTDSGTISRYERGALKPGVEMLAKIAKACDCSFEWLGTGEGDPPADVAENESQAAAS